ncbi:MAG: nucleotidyltransferase domain-containing protein [Chitinispirillia bacterium]|nr:nucleotidyltransferase domain-containing protein [Chitinispirillia bacterium]MCL2268152.1 nucleotidyltransferase domain-containing protein [Chitinispirillia bacterium]
MTENVRTEPDKIVNTLTETGIVSKIILFGSYACDEETENSDIALYILTPVKDDDDGSGS